MKTLLGLILIASLMADQPRKALLFYTESGEAIWKSQVETLSASQKGINERDIKIKSIPYNEENRSEWRKWEIDSTSKFTFLLIGRDGGEKLRSDEIVKAEKLFGLIDAMPMRKAEVKRN
ncbi:DUF4174 domain-containing protein [Dyadobacter sp. CY107]|uniref:DUF4174 domain-containing protein n=1 Tax=Dyadobacter fanqingshengii TaxID=2906443 RepID=UPI001F1DEA06|nr:DUF4174 domain-containing protein [Dyadobacter fanqingshengii]MCF2505471.1 DUF4174 domain-containing protein [Dyadobacter fanqingshengii]